MQGCTHALKLRDSIKLTDDGRTRLEVRQRAQAAPRLAPDKRALLASILWCLSLAGRHPHPHMHPHSPTQLGLDFRLGTGAWGGRSLAARLQPGGAPPAWLLGGLAPWAALQHQLDPQDRGAGLLRADPGHLSFSRRLTPRNGGRLPELTAKLGLSYDGGWVWRLPARALRGPARGCPPCPRPPTPLLRCCAPAGQPHAALGFGSLSLTLAVGAAMLAAGRTVRVTHQEVRSS